jgi:hypothetical protein
VGARSAVHLAISARESTALAASACRFGAAGSAPSAHRLEERAGTRISPAVGVAACGMAVALPGADTMKPNYGALAILLVSTALSSPALAEPTLELGDSFLPFVPGLFAYAVDRGTTSDRQVFLNFGDTDLEVIPQMEIAPRNDLPDAKYRVRITLSDSGFPNPNGIVVVNGLRFERNPTDPDLPELQTVVVDELDVSTNTTYTTTEYFDKVTSVTTTGLGNDATLAVEWWDGHEQEMNVAVGIGGVTAPECTGDYLVFFNGQEAVPDWDPASGTCSAGLLAGMRRQNGQLVSNSAYRGLYFGYATGGHDAFFHFDEELGHTNSPTTRQGWLNSLPDGAFFFDSTTATDPHLRSIVIVLQRRSDETVIDTARVLMTIAVGPFGNPLLQGRLAAAENPGAFTQLSPRGLDRLEPTHVVTMPYPIVPAGTQPRLSAAAIGVADHESPSIKVKVSELSNVEYWTEPNPAPAPNDGEFAGHLAYQDILRAARASHFVLERVLDACDGTVNPPACKNLAHIQFCVDDPPDENNFRIAIDRVKTYYDPARPLDALVVGDVTDMNLAFGGNSIEADFTLADIQGWLEASIDPADVRVEWNQPIFDPCTIKPVDRPLTDFLAGSDDYEDWFVCRDLSLHADSGTLADPIPFDIVPDGELIDTPFASPFAVNVTLAGITTDPGEGACGDDWMLDLITDELLAWEADTTAAIEVELMTSPGEDEALNRLLSPFEIGVERVDNPPAGTPPYAVHPLDTYSLSARIGKTASDEHGAQANSVDGLYVPYLTRSSPIEASPYITWFCPLGNSQTCNGLSGFHDSMLESGRDLDGDLFDVNLSLTTAHINQALWAQARRPDHLGSPSWQAELDIGETEIVDRATELGYSDVAAALAPFGSSFGVRYRQEAAPFTRTTDSAPPHLIYATPNIVIDLVSIAGDGTETAIATFLVDVIDPDHQLLLRTGGLAHLDAAWGDLAIFTTTTTFLPGCFDTQPGVSCADHLVTVVGSLLWPSVEATLLDMIEAVPAPQLFDAGQQSTKPRHLKNVRTFVSGHSVNLVADLCNPADADCE